MKLSNHELAQRYSIKAKMLGLNEINFRLKPNDNVELVEVLDKESDGVFEIPEFITEFMAVRPRNGLYIPQPLFQGCHFTEIRFNNNPNIKFSGNRLFYKMASTKLKVRIAHPECITNASEMFASCLNLKELDLEGFNTSNILNMSHMFSWCKELKELDLSSFDTRNVENMEGMFSMCAELRDLNLRSFNTSKVTRMTEMFKGCRSLTHLDLMNFDLRNVCDADYMLCHCISMEEVRMGEFNNEASTIRTFYNCGGVLKNY